MRARAHARVTAATAGRVSTIQDDVRSLEIAEDSVDVIVAGAELHHLRDKREWRAVFRILYRWLPPIMCSPMSSMKIRPGSFC